MMDDTMKIRCLNRDTTRGMDGYGMDTLAIACIFKWTR